MSGVKARHSGEVVSASPTRASGPPGGRQVGLRGSRVPGCRAVRLVAKAEAPGGWWCRLRRLVYPARPAVVRSGANARHLARVVVVGWGFGSVRARLSWGGGRVGSGVGGVVFDETSDDDDGGVVRAEAQAFGFGLSLVEANAQARGLELGASERGLQVGDGFLGLQAVGCSFEMTPGFGEERRQFSRHRVGRRVAQRASSGVEGGRDETHRIPPSLAHTRRYDRQFGSHAAHQGGARVTDSSGPLAQLARAPA